MGDAQCDAGERSEGAVVTRVLADDSRVPTVKSAVAVVLRDPRRLLAIAIIVLPVALVAPGYVKREVKWANGHRSVYAPPPQIKYNERLTEGVVAHVPSHASVAVVGADLTMAWTRWVAFVIAPRQLTNGRAQWTMVFGETPRQAHLQPTRSWRYGADWLVKS